MGCRVRITTRSRRHTIVGTRELVAPASVSSDECESSGLCAHYLEVSCVTSRQSPFETLQFRFSFGQSWQVRVCALPYLQELLVRMYRLCPLANPFLGSRELKTRQWSDRITK